MGSASTRFRVYPEAREGSQPGKNRQKQHKSGKNPEKLVEIKVFQLTLPRSKSHCYERRGSPHPHEYRGNVQALPQGVSRITIPFLHWSQVAAP
jgi:hypothetical protein